MNTIRWSQISVITAAVIYFTWMNSVMAQTTESPVLRMDSTLLTNSGKGMIKELQQVQLSVMEEGSVNSISTSGFSIYERKINIYFSEILKYLQIKEVRVYFFNELEPKLSNKAKIMCPNIELFDALGKAEIIKIPERVEQAELLNALELLNAIYIDLLIKSRF